MEDGANGQVEGVGHDHRSPAVLVAPPDQVHKAIADACRLADECHQVRAGCFNAGDGGSEGVYPFSLGPGQGRARLHAGEAFEDRGRDVVRENGVVEVEAEHSGHSLRIDGTGRRSTTLGRVEMDRARYLVSARGRSDLASLPPGFGTLDPVRLSSLLRRSHGAGEAAALGEQVALRARAAAWSADGGSLLYTAAGLQMMTHPIVAARRALRLAGLGLPVADLTCGIGGDLAACAAAGLRAVGLERDGATAILAACNVPGASVVRGDASRPPFELAGSAAIVDPSRRAETGRRFDPAAFSPPWDVALRVAASAGAGALKAPPGIGRQHLPPGAEVEYVQLGRSMREATIWLGAETRPGLRRAVLLPGDATLDSECPEEAAGPVPPGPFVFDPESCVTLAGLVRHLAYRLGARLLDEQVAYLTGPAAVLDPLCATFETLDVIPFSVERVKERLRQRGWTPAEIRRRAFPIEPDELRRLVGRHKGEPVTLLCTTLSGSRTVIVGRRVSPGS